MNFEKELEKIENQIKKENEAILKITQRKTATLSAKVTLKQKIVEFVESMKAEKESVISTMKQDIEAQKQLLDEEFESQSKETAEDYDSEISSTQALLSKFD